MSGAMIAGGALLAGFALVGAFFAGSDMARIRGDSRLLMAASAALLSAALILEYHA